MSRTKATRVSAKSKNTDKKKKTTKSIRPKNTSKKGQTSKKKEGPGKTVKKPATTKIPSKNTSKKVRSLSVATQPKNNSKTEKRRSDEKKSTASSAKKTFEKTKKKRKRTSAEQLPLTTEQLSQLPKPQYLVKLRIDAKTIIFVKDKASLKKWKAKFPNAEEIL